jgi:hypothetical protein
MNRHVNAIAGRLSLRPPQRRSLEILDRITEIVPPKKDVDVMSALAAIHSEFPTVTDFEREFPSLCFALATGVGKTRLKSISGVSGVSALPYSLLALIDANGTTSSLGIYWRLVSCGVARRSSGEYSFR